jgi:hypothetical protein
MHNAKPRQFGLFDYLVFCQFLGWAILLMWWLLP